MVKEINVKEVPTKEQLKAYAEEMTKEMQARFAAFAAGVPDATAEATESEAPAAAPEVYDKNYRPDLTKSDKRGAKSSLSDEQILYLSRGYSPADLRAWLKNPPKNIKNPSERDFYRVKAYETLRRPRRAVRTFEANGWFLVEEHDTFNLKCPLGSQRPYGFIGLFKHDENEEFVILHGTVETERMATEVYFGIEDPSDSYLAVEKRARAVFNSARTSPKVIPDEVARVEDYLEIAAELNNQAQITEIDIEQAPKVLGFAMALAYVRSGSLTKKNKPTEYLQRFQRVLSQVGNEPWPKRPQRGAVVNLDPYVQKLMVRCLKPLEGDKYTHATYGNKVETLAEAFKAVHDVFSVLYSTLNLRDKFFEKLPDIKKTYQELLDRNDNYPSFTLADVRTILAASWEVSEAFYHRVVLQLSTCLRNEEMDRLRREHLRDDNTLEYKQRVNGEYLINKTVSSGKVDPKDLVNPETSVVTRVILKHMQFVVLDAAEAERVKDFWKRVQPLVETEGAHQRSLRTTAATNLRFGLISTVARPCDPKAIKDMMAHLTDSMMTTRYAKNLPRDAAKAQNDPDTYFEIGMLEIDGHRATEEYLWNLFLLTDFLSRHDDRRPEQKTDDEIRYYEARLKRTVEQEKKDLEFYEALIAAKRAGKKLATTEPDHVPIRWKGTFSTKYAKIRGWVVEELKKKTAKIYPDAIF